MINVQHVLGFINVGDYIDQLNSYFVAFCFDLQSISLYTRFSGDNNSDKQRILLIQNM